MRSSLNTVFIYVKWLERILGTYRQLTKYFILSYVILILEEGEKGFALASHLMFTTSPSCSSLEALASGLESFLLCVLPSF